ncbi:MAG: hypothetical protein J1E98_08525 [Lachnospiraceae bacterium]|nr:hypothetical protein [Lachnospiraceae bacterium]
MNHKLEKLIDNLPIIKQLFKYDVYLTVMDNNGVIQGFSVPDGVTPQLHLGEAFHDPSGALDKVLKTGKPQRNRLPKEVMGEAFEGALFPIKDGNDIVGCITCTYSVDANEEMMDIALKFKESVDNINTSLHTLVNGIENLFKLLTNMGEMANSVEVDIQNASDVVNEINSNASRSNILALNASIEAARSGELGKGFAVVAAEMSKLANDNGSSSKEIKETLNVIMEHLVTISSSIKEAGNFAKDQKGNISSIEEVLQEMTVLAGKLEEDIEKR